MSVAGEVSAEERTRIEEVEVSFPGHNDVAIDGYLARPATNGPRPELIVIHEAFGLNDHIRDVARRFAAIGYLALAPDLYTREGMPADPQLEDIMRIMLAQPDERVVGDLEGAADFLAEQPQASGKVGCVGFCSGGRQTLLLACSSDRLDAAVDCWGAFVRSATRDAQTTPERPAPVIDLAENLSCPLMIAVGAEDQNPSPEDAEALTERLRAAGKEFELDVYEGAGHAFFADYRPNYVEEAAFRLWDRMTGFLGRTLT